MSPLLVASRSVKNSRYLERLCLRVLATCVRRLRDMRTMSARHVREMLRVTATNNNIFTTLYELCSTRSRHCPEFWRVVLFCPKPDQQLAVLSLKRSWLQKPGIVQSEESHRGPSLLQSPQLQQKGQIFRDEKVSPEVDPTSGI